MAEPAKSVLTFSGEHRWLSNFWVSPIRFYALGELWEFSTAEQVFQMAKLQFAELSLEELQELFEQVKELETPGQAKRFGRRIPRLDVPAWDAARDKTMRYVVAAKFTQSKELRQKFMDLEGYYLEEGNHWGDRYWGVDGTGENRLGKILMELRDDWLSKSRGMFVEPMFPEYHFRAEKQANRP